MVLGLMTASSLIIGALVGAGHALQHIEDEPQTTGSVDVSPVFPSAAIELDKDVVPIDTLSEFKEEQSVPGKKISSDAGSTDDEPEFKKQTDTTNMNEPPIEPSVPPVSFVVPDNVEDGAETTIDSGAGVPEEHQKKPYDIFEAVGFEDDEGFESWAK